MSDGPHDAPVPVATEQNYRKVLCRIHESRGPERCLERKTSTGASLAKSRGKAMAVNPKFRLAHPGSDPAGGPRRACELRLPPRTAPVRVSLVRPDQHERPCHALAEALTMTSQTDPSLAPYTGLAA